MWIIPSEKDNILEFDQYAKSDKISYIIYTDIESLTKKIGRSVMSTVTAFDHIENKHTSYRGKDCMKKFCESLREHTKMIIDFKEKNMLPLTKEKLKSHQDTKVCWI